MRTQACDPTYLNFIDHPIFITEKKMGYKLDDSGGIVSVLE
ncbi:hypothetical protein [Pleurocapsa sp. FMAR1]|nr:hypothetical protein [Pleurocapsa sp. FMAR1]